MQIRNVIIVSPHFPPSYLAGVHRARHLAKHLPAAGWKPIVLCVDERYHQEKLDPALASLVPQDVEILKVAAWDYSVTRRFGIGDISLRAWRHLRSALFHLLSTRRIDAIFITGSPYYQMLMAPAIRRTFSIPVVLDFQDPWVSDWGATLPTLSKGGVSHRLGIVGEAHALKGASHITSVSEIQNRALAARHGWVEERMTVIPIGCDPDDFRTSATPVDGRLFAQGNAAIYFSYVGNCWPRCIPVLKQLLRGFRLARQASPDLASRVCLQFVGTSNQPNDDSTYKVLPIAVEEGVADGVVEIPQRLPYLEALQIISRSQAVLLIGSDEPHYTASKVFPVLMSGRPYFSVLHGASSAHAILSAAGGGLAFSFATAAELERLGPELADGLLYLVRNADHIERAPPSAYADYEAKNIAKRFGSIFDDLSAASRSMASIS